MAGKDTKVARPAQPPRRPNEVKGRIMQAALTSFARHGFNGTRMRGLADDAGITIQLLTHHVKSKENLWQMVIQDLSDRYLEVQKASGPLPDEAGPGDQLKAEIETLVRFTASVPELHRMVTLEASHATPRLLSLLETFARHNFERMCNLIERAQREGTVRRVDPARLRFAIVAMAAVPFSVSAEYEYLTGRSPFLEAEIERTIQLIDDLVFTDTL